MPSDTKSIESLWKSILDDFYEGDSPIAKRSFYIRKEAKSDILQAALGGVAAMIIVALFLMISGGWQVVPYVVGIIALITVIVCIVRWYQFMIALEHDRTVSLVLNRIQEIVEKQQK